MKQSVRLTFLLVFMLSFNGCGLLGTADPNNNEKMSAESLSEKIKAASDDRQGKQLKIAPIFSKEFNNTPVKPEKSKDSE
jgi:hypothetical protein